MSFSPFLDSRRNAARRLMHLLRRTYPYVSILGADTKVRSFSADKNISSISPQPDSECGFVIKAYNGTVVLEYSLDDICGDIPALADKIASALRISEKLKANSIEPFEISDPPLIRSFSRRGDLDQYSDSELLQFCKELSCSIMESRSSLLNAIVGLTTTEISKLFISENRELDQYYTWVNGFMLAINSENGKVVRAMESSNERLLSMVLEQLPQRTDLLLHKARKLTGAGSIVPGVYDVICAPSITGLIAHEAFGHGVEMDQFVKDRALAKEYVGKYVASPIVNMRDGAASTLSAASYFFDDDGVLAGDTQIIKDGILVAGISDMASAAQLGTQPSGNGRRESTRRKAYTRMSNTFFEKGSDSLESMVASIDHGYMLFETDNGMEDPKNWAIQCVAQYGIEIVDGKLTDNWVSPVVMSGYVPDLLKSISMVGDELVIIGAGGCGKGYKEWVRVSDGGPAVKARVKLG